MAEKRKRGRPKKPKSETLSPIYGARLKKEDEKRVLEAIKKSGLRKSDWIRTALVEKAQS